MRILYVHDRMGACGGAEANILVTATEMGRRGHTVALAYGAEAGRAATEWTSTFQERYPFDGEAGAMAVQQAISRFGPDAIYAHTVSSLAVLQVLSACSRPVVRMVHDHAMYCMRGYKYGVFSRRICRRAASWFCVFPCGAALGRSRSGGIALRWVSYRKKRREIALNRRLGRLVVASEYMRGELLRNGFAPEQIEIHAPVPRSVAASNSASFAGRNRIVYAGQIVRGKGVDVLLESLARVTVPYECIIIGDGSHRPACERVCDRLGLRAQVRFTGFLPQDRLAEYYREASLAMMSSLWPEPFGATGLEAMRCGLPVVAFDAGGIREWLLDGVNGYLVPWLDRVTYAARIEALLCDKDLARRLGANGRKMVDERFNFGAYIDGLENLFARMTEVPTCAATFATTAATTIPSTLAPL